MSWLSQLFSHSSTGREVNAVAAQVQPLLKAEEAAAVEAAIHKVAVAHGMTLAEPDFNEAVLKALDLPTV